MIWQMYINNRITPGLFEGSGTDAGSLLMNLLSKKYSNLDQPPKISVNFDLPDRITGRVCGTKRGRDFEEIYELKVTVPTSSLTIRKEPS